jgi:hypothetical protein
MILFHTNEIYVGWEIDGLAHKSLSVSWLKGVNNRLGCH